MKHQFPKKLKFLFEPHPFKVIYGGRGGLKSMNMAGALVTMAASRKLRVLCTRETQTSIRESVHRQLADEIERLGLSSLYTVQQYNITSRCGSEFIFAGLKHNTEAIKSIKGVNICWVEEAQTVSKESWEMLLPTIREPDSEIWVSFNPVLETDDTYRRWVINPPPGAVVVKTTYRDNPWFPENLRILMEHDKATDEATYRHVWEGECRSAVEGAVYGLEMQEAADEGRITKVPYDRTRPVDTFWDLGYGDKTAIWFGQAVGGWYHMIDYIEDRGKAIEWYLIQLQQRGYKYGTDWLPHDALDVIIHKRLGGANDRSIEMILREAGRKVRMAPKLYVASGINAVRTVLPQCRFDEDKCYDGLRALRMYQWGKPSPDGKLKREPLHDEASHGADAFRVAALCLREPKEELGDTSWKPLPVSGGRTWAG